MLSKKNRLSPVEFRGQKAHSFFIAKFKVQFVKKSEKRGRFAIIIPSVVVKKAVDRHYWKRQIAKILRPWQNKGIDAIISVKNKPEKAEKEALLGDLAEEINKIFND